jgi:hypothetical protein
VFKHCVQFLCHLTAGDVVGSECKSPLLWITPFLVLQSQKGLDVGARGAGQLVQRRYINVVGRFGPYLNRSGRVASGVARW